MIACKWDDHGKCTFPLGCGFERDDMCLGFERFDISWNDRDAMTATIERIQEMIKEYDRSI